MKPAWNCGCSTAARTWPGPGRCRSVWRPQPCWPCRGAVMGRPLLRLKYHRGTTAHVASVHPFSVQAPLRCGGPYIGVDLVAGGAEFCWDPFDAYAAEVVTNPNCWVLGEPGFGKSALIKCLLWRMAALYGTGTGGRWMAIADPKGEYSLLAEYLGLTVIRLTPGGAPSDTMLSRLRRSGDDLAGDLAQVVYALDNLLSRSLRGMFDGPTSVPLRWDGPGVVLDLSAVPLESAALPLVMVAAAGWLQQLMACPGPQRVQVLDEAWAFLKTRHTAGFLQSCFKLGRSYGTANICLSHRISDLAAQADDGTATAKIGKGLIADSATKIILRQAPDQIATTVEHAGLTEPQADAVARLARGCALWKVGGHTTLVDHIVGPGEIELTDTDHRMRGLGPPGLDTTEPPDANSGVAAIDILDAPEAGGGHRGPAQTARGSEMAKNRTGGGRRSPVVGTSPSEAAVDRSQCA